MPRLLARLVMLPLVVALAGVVLLLPGSARACACGAAYVPGGHTVRAGDELAFLSWARPGRERLEMALSLTADTPDLAVLVPTPAVPTVAQGDALTFDRLAVLTAPPPEESHDHGDGNGAGAPAAPPSVVSTTVLEDVVATVIKGGTSAGVTRWLARHGYAQKPRVRPVIDEYLRDGWVLTAVKLRADRPFDGQTDPIVLTFDSDRLVYPMRLSSVADEVGRVTVYTLDRQYDARTDPDAQAMPGLVTGATIEAGSYSDGPLRSLAAAGYTRVTKLTYDAIEPATITSDLIFGPDSSGRDLSEDPSDGSSTAAESGDHAGGADGGMAPWAVGALSAAVVLAAGGVLLWRRQRHWSRGD